MRHAAIGVGLYTAERSALAIRHWKVPEEFARRLVETLLSEFGEPVLEAVATRDEAVAAASEVEAIFETPFIWRDGS